MQKASEMKVENLDHLGLIAGLIDEIGIVQKINELIGEQPGEIVSPGLVVKAHILHPQLAHILLEGVKVNHPR